jgi:hypothetical protein
MVDYNTHGGYFAPQGLLKINEGGSHEENPNGGVQLGVDQQGIPNLVEEGEMVYDDFVYSDNIKADGGFLEKNNLPTKYAEKLYSEIAEALCDEIGEQNDPISLNGLNVSLRRLAQAQEAQKQAEEEEELLEALKNIPPEELAAMEEYMMQHQAAQQQQPMMPEEQIQPEVIAPAPVEGEEIAPAVPMMAMGGNIYRGGRRLQKMFDSVTEQLRNVGTNNGIQVDPVTGVKYEQPLVPEEPLMNAALMAAQPGTIVEKAIAPSVYRGIAEGLANGDAAYEAFMPMTRLRAAASRATARPKAAMKNAAESFAGKAKATKGSIDNVSAQLDRAKTAKRIAADKLDAAKQEYVDANTVRGLVKDPANKKAAKGLASKASSDLKDAKSVYDKAKWNVAGLRLERDLDALKYGAQKAGQFAFEHPVWSTLGLIGAGYGTAGTISAVNGNGFYKPFFDTAKLFVPKNDSGSGDIDPFARGGIMNKFENGTRYVRDENGNVYKLVERTDVDGKTTWSDLIPVEEGTYDPSLVTPIELGKYDSLRYVDPRYTKYGTSPKANTFMGEPEGIGFHDLVPPGGAVPFADYLNPANITVYKNDEDDPSYIGSEAVITATKNKGFNTRSIGSASTNSSTTLDPSRFGDMVSRVSNPLTLLQSISEKGVRVPKPTDNDVVLAEAQRRVSDPALIEKRKQDAIDSQYNLARFATRSDENPFDWRLLSPMMDAAMGLATAATPADHYDYNPIRPYLPYNRIRQQYERYNPIDVNLVTNKMRAQADAVMRSLRNAGIGPSVGANMIAADYTAGQNEGNALANIWDANNQRYNQVIAQNNAADAAIANHDWQVEAARANYLNQTAPYNQRTALQTQMLNNEAEQDKYNALAGYYKNTRDFFANKGWEDINRDMANTNRANLGYRYADGRLGRVIYDPKTGKEYRVIGCGGTLLKKHKK